MQIMMETLTANQNQNNANGSASATNNNTTNTIQVQNGNDKLNNSNSNNSNNLNGSNSNNNLNNNNNNNNNNNANNITNNKCNLIVNYLPQSVKENDFNALFSKIGPLKSCRLMFDRQTGYSFGYGFVEYTTEEDAKKAIDSLNGFQIEHKRLKVSLARPNCEETKNTNLYLRNIPTTYDEQNLHDLFSPYGEVIQVRILRDQNTSFSRRIGFVIMGTKQMAQLAIQNLDNQVPPNSSTNEPIFVKYADEDGKKKNSHRGQNNHGHHGHHHGHQQYHQNGRHNNGHQNQFNQQFHQQQNLNAFTMLQQQQQQQQQNGLNAIANLGKIKNRTNGHQNRFNPIAQNLAGAVTANNPLNGANGTANAFNTWNMNALNPQQQQQQQFNSSSFPNQMNNAGGGFDTLINTLGASAAGAYNNQFSQFQQGNLLDLSGGAAAAAGQNTNGGLNNQFQQGQFGSMMDHQQQQNKMQIGGVNGGVGNTIYVYGIGQYASESDLYSLFANCGRILRVNVIKNQKTGLCKGFGFVVFDSLEEANFAVHNMNGYMYNGRPLQVQMHME